MDKIENLNIIEENFKKQRIKIKQTIQKLEDDLTKIP